MRQRKTRDEYQLHVYYGSLHGWEHEVSEDTWREAKERRKEYRENCPQYPCKIVKRRIPLKPAPVAVAA
jgi:hypothetical protein